MQGNQDEVDITLPISSPSNGLGNYPGALNIDMLSPWLSGLFVEKLIHDSLLDGYVHTVRHLCSYQVFITLMIYVLLLKKTGCQLVSSLRYTCNHNSI